MSPSKPSRGSSAEARQAEPLRAGTEEEHLLDPGSLPEQDEGIEEEEFSEIVVYTGAGFVGGLVLGVVLDAMGFEGSAIGQWLVRTLAGSGESVMEGLFSVRRRMRGGVASMAEAYGWGKLIGMMIPWVVDWGSRLAGVDVYGIQGFYIPFFYALGDQIGGNFSSTLFLRRREGSWRGTMGVYVRHPVLLASLSVILIVPVGLLTARLLGFSPTTQVFTALETITANLCWVPPLVGYLHERRARRATKSSA